MRYLDRLRAGGWTGAAIYLAIALATLAVLAYLFKKTDPNQSTSALMVMLMYVTVGGFMLLASRLFITKRDDNP
ncbi:MAG: hypothetical protein JWO42_586 [Chloroflexi bacterium]|jgi:predicted membrane channel-forming protein YqfA (hemolysin III family)|nr:hypothetical protein [Chloroflexota bacterium]